MGRMSKHKAAKAAVTKRRKKTGSASASMTTVSASSSSGGSGARRTPASLAESVALANAGSASPTGSTSTAGSSTPSSSSSAKECEQCGNPTMLDGVSASRTWTTSKKQLAANGCQICDFVTYRKSQRPCVHCERAACEHFCEWCGNGYHTKCARVRDEKVNAPNGFCCRKCEAEQADDDDTSGSAKDAEAEEIGARCGSCRLPFNASSRDDANEEEEMKGPEPAEEAGFKVNQSVLVENEEVLYNAVITDVDLKGERIKIHFIRWSKSFDNWYAMDDERINESLACDCCNHWFHIGCLPPIKSSGRFKDTTYVCPTCIDDAKHFHNGTRPKAKASASSSSSAHGKSRKNSVSEDAPAVPSKRKSAKPIVTSDDEQDMAAAKKASDRSKKKRKLSVSSDSPMKKPELSRAASRSKSPETVPRADVTADDVSMDDGDDGDESRAAAANVPNLPALSSAANTLEPPAVSSRAVASDESSATTTTTGDNDATAATSEKPSATTESSNNSSSAENDPSNDVSAGKSHSKDEKTASAPAPTMASRRKASSHSVSSLLNSPSPNEKPATPPLHPNMVSLSMLDENRRSLTSSFDVLVKTERSSSSHHHLPPLPSSSSSSSANGRGAGSSSKTATAKIEPYQNPSNWPVRAPPAPSASSSSKLPSSRSSLSAFDILRQVATQSISGELDAVALVKPKKERQRASAAKAKAMKAEKAAAAAAAAAGDKTGAKAPTGSSGSGATASEQERLFQSKERVHLNSFVDLHFSIRKEMYLKFCGLEEQGLLDRDTAQLLRSLIYPTSDKFQDLKFVYLVNKDLSPLYLTKRLLEVVPVALGGTGVAAPPAKSQSQTTGASTPSSSGGGAGTGSVASSPASTNHTAQPLPTIVPPGLTIPSFSEIIASEKAAALLQQQQQRQHQQLQQHLQQQHQTLQAAALATSTALELRKKVVLRPDVIAKELAPLPSASAVTSAVTAAASAVSAALSSSMSLPLATSASLSSSVASSSVVSASVASSASASTSTPSVQSDTLLSRS